MGNIFRIMIMAYYAATLPTKTANYMENVEHFLWMRCRIFQPSISKALIST